MLPSRVLFNSPLPRPRHVDPPPALTLLSTPPPLTPRAPLCRPPSTDWPVRPCPQASFLFFPVPGCNVIQPVSFSLSTSVPLEEFDLEGTSKFSALWEPLHGHFKDSDGESTMCVGYFPCTFQCTGVDPREKTPREKNSTKLSWKPSSSCPKWCQVLQNPKHVVSRPNTACISSVDLLQANL